MKRKRRTRKARPSRFVEDCASGTPFKITPPPVRTQPADGFEASAEDGFELAWRLDENYTGTKGGKWIGDGDDAGKKPRYQKAQPGTRQKKQPTPAGGKKPAAPRKSVPPAQILAELEPHGTDVAKLAGALAKHTYASLQGLAKHLAQKANGKTADLAARLLAKLEERAGQGQTQRPAEMKPPAAVADPKELAGKLRSERADEHADEVIAAARKAAAGLSVDGFRQFVGQVIGDEPRKGQSKKKMLTDLESIVNQVGTSRAQTRHIGEPIEKKAAPDTRPLVSATSADFAKVEAQVMRTPGHPDDLKEGWPTLPLVAGSADKPNVRVYKKEYAAPLAEQRKARDVLAEVGRYDNRKGTPRVGDLARTLADKLGVSLTDAYRQIIQWREDDVITLQLQSNTYADYENAAAGLTGPAGTYGYFQVS